MNQAVFIFTPSHQQQKHLETVFDSIAKLISIPFKFCLFTDKLSEGFFSKYDVTVKIIKSEDIQIMQNLYYREGRGDIPAFSAYAQFVLPRYFSEFSHFIYMEVDQVCKDDLAILWDYCITNNLVLAAAPYLDDFFNPSTVESFDELHPGATCFNTGVLFVDVNFWISNDLELLCFNELVLQQKLFGKRLDFYAQGAINNALHFYIHELPWFYNVQGLGNVEGIAMKIINSAKILHWTGTRKPWKIDGLYKDLYYDDPSLKNLVDYRGRIIKKLFKRLRYFLSSLKHALAR
jgi:lipopolysaccharide biosynthesis glycosyltransferase